MEIENTFILLEKLDLKIKEETKKLSSTKNQETITQVQSSVQEHLLNYQEYLDKIALYCSDNDETTSEKLQIKQEQMRVTRTTYRKCLLAAQQEMQTQNKNELLGNTNNSLRNRKNGQNKKNSSNFEQLKSLNRTMSESVMQSQKVLVSLKEQEEENLKTSKNVTDMKSNIDDGDHLISKYKQRARTDQMLIRLGVFTFFMTCAYIILKRVFGFFL